VSTYALQAQGVNKRFGAVAAAQDINVSVPEGAIYGLIGSNGAGKTTFVNMVTGYIKPDSGSIECVGRNITALKPRAIARIGVCRSFQIPQLFIGLSTLENLQVALSINAAGGASFWRRAVDSSDRERALEILEQFGIADQRERLIPELSNGARKLLDIAMAMAGQPKVMLLDEPTSGVAADEKFPIMDRVIEALTANAVTILFVEHDMSIVTRYAQRILAFYDGRIIADDAPDEVLSDPDVQRYVTGTLR
jgi:branched-chain amino acid transport system ATP-binding protein